jgi:hypothetical protein
MRGKLRDKRAAEKRDYFKRETIERRRPGKRTRPVRHEEDDYELENYEPGEDEIVDEEEEIEIEISPNRIQQKKIKR